MTNTRKSAIMMGYITVAIQSFSSIVLTRICLKCLGFNIYGIYQMVFSIAQYVLLFDFGIAATVTRFRVEYLENKRKEDDENLLFNIAVILVSLMIVIVAVGLVIYLNLEAIYTSLSESEVHLAQNMMLYMIGQIVFTLGEHYFQGIALSEEKYGIIKIVALVRIIAKVLIVSSLLLLGAGVMTLVYFDFLVTLLSLVTIIAYDIKNLHFKVKYHSINRSMLKNITFLMTALMLQSLSVYVNSSSDKTILGILLDAKAVAVYSVAATINLFFASIPNSMNSLYIPKATQMIVRNASGEELTDLVIRPGRIQFMFCGAIVACFALYGQKFVQLWVGTEAEKAWEIAIILIVPYMFPLVQNVCLSILTAMNKGAFRSFIAISTSLLNIVITVILVNSIGILGSPIGTSISVILGNIIATNIYYKKRIHLNVIRMYKEIFSRTVWCIVLAGAASMLTLFLPFTGWLEFMVNCVSFIIVYAVLMWVYGANDYEKNLIHIFVRVKRHTLEGQI